MHRNKIAASLLPLLLLCASASLGQTGNAPSSAPQNGIAFAEARGRGASLSPVFTFSTPGYSYRILSSGKGRRTGGNSPPRSFNLQVETGFRLEWAINFAEYKGDLLLICGYTNELDAAGFITRLDGRTLRIKWKAEIPAFNVGRGLIEDGYVYITAIGFVGKVTLRSGAYVWRHDNLYQTGEDTDDAFNSFELPEIKEDTVLFREKSYHRKIVATVEINKLDGRVINITR